MGMFDSVVISCPHCGKPTEVQSKAGDCLLRVHNENSVPVEIAVDLDCTADSCDSCSEPFVIHTRARRYVPLHASRVVRSTEDDGYVDEQTGKFVVQGEHGWWKVEP